MWIKKPREALKLRNALMKQSHQDALAEAEEAYRQWLGGGCISQQVLAKEGDDVDAADSFSIVPHCNLNEEGGFTILTEVVSRIA